MTKRDTKRMNKIVREMADEALRDLILQMYYERKVLLGLSSIPEFLSMPCPFYLRMKS